MPNSSDFNRFAVNPVNLDISRSLFNMDHSVKFSCDVGEVVPFDCIEVLPGDTFTIDTSKVVRLQPLVSPIMDEVIIDTYYFFVPNRLVWNHWINFMGENTESAWTPEVTYNIPTLEIPEGGFKEGTVADYLGVPLNTGYRSKINALPFRGYALICDQWFRSEALMDPVHVHVDDTSRTGVNTGDQVTDIELGGKPFIACKYFDYFTSALPSPQRGSAVQLPFMYNDNYHRPFPAELPVFSSRYDSVWSSGEEHPYHSGKTPSNSNKYPLHFAYLNASTNKFVDANSSQILGHGTDGYIEQRSNGDNTTVGNDLFANNLWVTLNPSVINTVNINDLRTAFAVQKYLEKSARYGGRYQEFIKGFFNVDSPDARLQRTEYLGGSRLSLNINQVEQTTPSSDMYDSDTPLGTVAGMSVTADQNSDFTKSFTEHGFIIGCAVVRYHHSYQDGINRMFLRRTNYDYYNPIFANLGEQEIFEDEIYLKNKDANLNPLSTAYYGGVFGYNERWAEYRYLPNRVAGEMRSRAVTSLDMWHLADNYPTPTGDHVDDRVTLSADWIREDKTNLDRCLAVTSSVANQVICDFYIKTEASRPLPLYSIPGLIDHH